MKNSETYFIGVVNTNRKFNDDLKFLLPKKELLKVKSNW
uniref:Uncharacterized protein n=1 Tax=Anguilla anguilla TaxID=7936 RepID=A0A0E9SH20_ANGAN